MCPYDNAMLLMMASSICCKTCRWQACACLYGSEGAWDFRRDRYRGCFQSSDAGGDGLICTADCKFRINMVEAIEGLALGVVSKSHQKLGEACTVTTVAQLCEMPRMPRQKWRLKLWCKTSFKTAQGVLALWRSQGSLRWFARTRVVAAPNSGRAKGSFSTSQSVEQTLIG